jgi:hypothetical protein
MLAERYRHLERSVDPHSDSSQVAESIAIARWIGLAFDELTGLRSTLEDGRKAIDNRKDLARAAFGAGGSDYMEADSDERETQ